MAPKKTLENPNPKSINNPFTDLPDRIIHNIFSFLDTDNVVSMRAVSKRLLQVCTTSPYLSFTSKPCDQFVPSERCKQFREFLDRFWSDRGSNNIDAASIDITYLHIEWTCSKCKFDDGASMVLAWITKAVMFNVQEFHLKLGPTCVVELPECVFNCKSLTILNIEGGCVSFPRLVFHSLQVLLLKGPNGMKNNGENKISIGEWISNSCPSLKKLSLKQLRDRNLIITSSSLEEVNVSVATYGSKSDYVINILMEKLKILSLDLPCTCLDSGMNNIVRIIAPNLHDFTFNAQFGECEFSGEYTSLRKASISVPADCNYMVALHRSISLATTLQLDLLAFKNLFKNDGCRQLLIENLHYLTLKADTSSNDEYIPSIISFLKLLRNLKSLTIKHPWQRYSSHQLATYSPSEKYTSDMERNQPRNLMLFQSLKEVVIELRTGTKEIGLIKYLMKYAQSLEKVTVFYTNELFYALAYIGIPNFKIASTSLELIFVEKEFVREEEDAYQPYY